MNRSDNVELDGNSAVSEVFQANHIDECEILEQGPLEYVYPRTCSLLWDLNQENKIQRRKYITYKERKK